MSYTYMAKITSTIDYDVEKSRVIIRRDNDTHILERYYINTKTWVRDYELSRMYYGGFEVEDITEEKAMELISKLKRKLELVRSQI